MTILVISIKIEDVNRRVRRAARVARTTRVHVLDVCVHVLDVCVRVRRVRCVYLAVSKLFIY
jgi:hypothetical protein